MTFTNSTTNLCIFCYKSIPPEYHHDSVQNTIKVSRFLATLSKLVDCKRINKKRTMSSSFSSSWNSCEDCDKIITQFSSIYHEMKCLELQLFCKVEHLGKLMNLADEVVESTKLELMETGFENGENTNVSHNFNGQPNSKDFRTFRSKIKEKCDDGRKMSMYQPRVSLKRLGPKEFRFEGIQASEIENSSSTENYTEDFPSPENLFLDDNTHVNQDAAEGTTNLTWYTTQTIISTNPLEHNFKTVQQEIEDANSITYASSAISHNMQDNMAKIEISTYSNLFLDEEDYDHLNSTSNQHLSTDNNSTVEKSFKCEQCEKCFKQKKTLVQHLEFHKSSKDWKYECLVCGRKCALKQNLTKHMASHTEEKKWKCTTCDRGFKTEEFLKMHSISHKNPDEWKYECWVCGKKCVNKQSLERHELVHSKARPCKCKICGKGYKSKHLLKRHLVYHESPEGWKHECEKCKKKFASKGCLTRHLKDVHKK